MPSQTHEASWRAASTAERLTRGTIHLWRISLPGSEPENFDELLEVLAADERSRARRFHFERDRANFVVSHAALRSILAQYLACDAPEIEFGYGEQDKPFLQNPLTPRDVHFNLSHSGAIALVAVTLEREVGVDVEKFREVKEDVAKRFFSSREIEELYALPPDIQEHAFFLCWTRKEAYIKARGQGLSHPLDAFDVTLTPGEPARLIEDREDSNFARWSLFNLELDDGYAGAVAIEGSAELKLLSWD